MADNRVTTGLLLVVLGLALSAHRSSADTWHYPKPNPDGTLDQSPDWGGNCSTGRRQSPIDVNSKAAVKGTYPAFVFDNYDQPIKDASLVNSGHSIQANIRDTPASIYGGGLRNKYVLEQFHFHWSSEHTVADQRYALEVHIVHRNTKYDSLEEAIKYKGGVAALAVLFHVDEEPNETIQILLDATASLKDKVNDPVKLPETFILENLLPKSRTEYFRYEGSLTTPLCGESVVWTVFPESLPVSLDQLEEFKTVRDEKHEELVLNYRPVQPLNARALVWVTDAEAKPDDGGSSLLRINSVAMTAGLLLSIVICYFRT